MSPCPFPTTITITPRAPCTVLDMFLRKAASTYGRKFSVLTSYMLYGVFVASLVVFCINLQYFIRTLDAW